MKYPLPRGTRMHEAWEAAGVNCSASQARSMGWFAHRSEGSPADRCVFTLWIDAPHALCFTARGKAYGLLDLVEPPCSTPDSPKLVRKHREYWANLRMLVTKEIPIRILAIAHRRDADGKFRPGNDGNAVPVWIRDYATKCREGGAPLSLCALDLPDWGIQAWRDNQPPTDGAGMFGDEK